MASKSVRKGADVGDIDLSLDYLRARGDDPNDHTSKNRPETTQVGGRYRVNVWALTLMALLAPYAHAAGPFRVGVNFGVSKASGVGHAKDFGFSGAYRLNRAFAVRLGYESITSFEMTVFSLAVTARYPLSARVHLVGLAGGAHWSESPSGRPSAHGLNPLLGAGLSYRFDSRWSSELQYQWIHGGHTLGQNLQSVLLSLRYRL